MNKFLDFIFSASGNVLVGVVIFVWCIFDVTRGV
jgi:hypothetical protein